MMQPPLRSTLFPYTTLFRSLHDVDGLRRAFCDLHNRLSEIIGALAIRMEVQMEAEDVDAITGDTRSEEHTSELQSHVNLVCRLLLEKKKGSYKESVTIMRMA